MSNGKKKAGSPSDGAPAPAPADEMTSGKVFGALSKALGVPLWGELIFLALVVLGLGIWWVHSEIDNTNSQLGRTRADVQRDFDSRIDGVQRDLNGRMDNLSNELVQGLLGRAGADSKAGKLQGAKRDIEAAQALLAVSRGKKIRVGGGFFSDAVLALNNLAAQQDGTVLAGPINQTRLDLAEYRSALEPPPIVSPTGEAISPGTRSPARILGSGTGVAVTQHLGPEDGIYGSRSLFYGDLPPGADFLAPVVPSVDKNTNPITGIIFVGASQTLDHFRWKDVTFVAVEVKYNGGDVILDNVRFADCTFDVPPSERGTQFLDYAAEQKSEIVFGSPK